MKPGFLDLSHTLLMLEINGFLAFTELYSTTLLLGKEKLKRSFNRYFIQSQKKIL